MRGLAAVCRANRPAAFELSVENMLLQFLFVLVAILVGARMGGIGLGVMGGIGLSILVFIFGLEPTSPPVDVMLMIVAVIAAAGCMQAAGGLDLMVRQAERLLRKHPSRITLLSPLVTYLFTFVAGTGHVAYSVLPVIAEVARETKIRPERPLSIAVIASQQAITASPISAAVVALLSLLADYQITLLDILIICIPSTLVGVVLGALYSLKMGKGVRSRIPASFGGGRIYHFDLFGSDSEPFVEGCSLSRHFHSGNRADRAVRISGQYAQMWRYNAEYAGGY